MIATVVISAILVVIVSMIIRSMVIKACSGQSVGCGGGCSGCSMSSCASRTEHPQLIQIQVPERK